MGFTRAMGRRTTKLNAIFALGFVVLRLLLCPISDLE
nr:MAG TPA: hypothetical protein [Inoviridae sp.]